MIDSLRRVSAAGIRLYKARCELALVELHQEMERTRRRFMISAWICVLSLVGALLINAMFVVLLAPVLGWAWTLALFGVLHLVGAVILFAINKNQRTQEPRIFSSTLREFEKDCDKLCGYLDSTNRPRVRREKTTTVPIL